MNGALKPEFNRVLLIDDEPGIRRMMTLDLTADGYQVATAEDGASGLEAFRRYRPEIVITDLKMPGMDGIEVLRRLKQESPETEVIVITGHGDLDLAVQSLQLEASDFITKPVSEAALSVALSRAAQRLSLKGQLKAHTQDLERRVAEATAQALASERLAAIGQTVSALVHSLKNMLAGLKGGAYMVRQGHADHSPELVGQGLDMLERNLARVARLVRDLLTLGKPRQPELEPVDLADLAAEAADCLGSEAQAKGVRLELRRPSAPVLAQAERQALLDALLNLVGNGLDAAATVSGGQVVLSLEQGCGQAAIQVADNGPGLDEEALAHIFEGFYSSKGAGGTGLGLMVCRKIAQEHGGDVELDNRPGQGATFRLVLPLPQPGRQAATPETS